jgi:hypothetical protein
LPGEQIGTLMREALIYPIFSANAKSEYREAAG